MAKNQKQIEEYIKCAKDPVYFINTYGQAFNIKTSQISKIKCFEYQENLLKNLKDNQNNIVLKSRQTGISVITAGFIAWKLIFSFDERILVVADNHIGALRFLEHVNVFLDSVPSFLLPGTKTVDNQKKIEFSNGCWLRAVASSKNAGRGESLTMLVLDEAAHIKEAEDIWMGAGMALSATGGKCVIISTPRGTGSFYHTHWVGAEKNENGFVPFRIHWTEHPIFSQGMEEKVDEEGRKYLTSPWYEKECERLHHDKVKIAQELDLSFEGSGALVIESTIINKYEKDCINTKPLCYYDYKLDGDRFTTTQNTFHVWNKPVEGSNYIVSSDVARGDSADFSTIQVLDANNLVQVAEYQGKVFPDEFAKIIYNIGKDYNNAYLCVECNSFGLSTTLTLKNVLKYDSNRMYHSKSIVKLFDRINNYEVDKDGEIPGFQTTTRTRPILINALIKYMRGGQIKINSIRLLNEFKTFVYKGEKAEHEKGYNDDLIFALAIGLLMRDTEIDNVFWNKQIVKAMLEGISRSSTSWSNVEGGEVKKTDGDLEDLTWLYGKISLG